MSVVPDLFIGLVTHPRSRFAESQSDAGLMRSVERALRARGCEVSTGVSDRDEYDADADALPLTRHEVQASIRGELDCELRWRSYLAGTTPTITLKLLMAVRKAWRTFQFAPPWRRITGDDPGARMVKRLVNIELSHLRIMGDAVESGARWALLIEDDASAADTEVFARELTQFIERADATGQPITMNLSESFTLRQLGLEHLLTPVPNQDPWSVFSAKRPVTNTVCAVLYRGDFLARLLAVMRSIPVSPVVPIDFKVNEAMMRLSAEMKPGDCWVASPAPLTQQSGVPKLWLST